VAVRHGISRTHLLARLGAHALDRQLHGGAVDHHASAGPTYQPARTALTGAVTVPDLLRDRFNCPALGITAGLIILLFLPFNLVAQFKAGALVMAGGHATPSE
jgi:hypothetical protein